MDIQFYISLALKVLTDLRVIAITVAVLLVWALFRFVAIISSRKAPRRRVKVRAQAAESSAAAESAASEEG